MTLKDQSITFIGPGAMASAMASRLIEGGIQTPDKILMSGPIVDELEALEKRLGVSTTSDNLKAVKNADVVVLSIKPQIIQEVMDELRGSDTPLERRIFVPPTIYQTLSKFRSVAVT